MRIGYLQMRFVPLFCRANVLDVSYPSYLVFCFKPCLFFDSSEQINQSLWDQLLGILVLFYEKNKLITW